jgi:alpha-tubulin suppressor-like RCC1 family protein
MVPSQPTPVEVTALGTNVIRVAAGTTTCAIRQGGSLWCWGNNVLGQVGDGISSGDEIVDGQPHRILPQQLALSNIVSVAAGTGHTCAVEAGGDLHCWGSNSLGQIGNATTSGSACGSNICRPSPTRVTALLNLVADVAVGGTHTCAVTKDGRLYCWGENTTGQLGTGSGGESCQPSLLCRSSPAQVTALANDVAQVAAGGSHTCAVLKNGTLWCWGVNNSGQIGNGTQTGSPCTLPGGSTFNICVTSPAQVSALGANVAQVVTAGDRTCARLKDRSLWCWGDNNWGQIGDGTTPGSDCRFNGHYRLAPARAILCGSP